MDTPPFLLFIHIPKAAGITLRSIVDGQYGADNVLTYYHQPSAQMLDNLDYHLRAARHDYRALIGHFRYGVDQKLSRQASYVTFVRDPVALAVSSYFKNLKTDRAHFTKADGTLVSLEESLDREAAAYANQQVKYLTGLSADAEVNDNDLVTCLNNITAHFTFVGTVEKFNPSVLLLSKLLDWKPCLYDRLNRGGSHPAMPRSTLSRIAEINLLDQKLYEIIGRRLAQQLKDQKPLFNAALSELEGELARRAVDHDGHYSEAEISPANLPTVMNFLGGDP